MIRALSILSAIVALAVSAAPVASAGPNSKTTAHSAGLAPDFGIYLSLRKAPPKPPGLGVTYFKGELVGIEPSLRNALPKPRGISGDVCHYELIGANDDGLLLDADARAPRPSSRTKRA